MWGLKNTTSLLIDGVLCLFIFNRRTISAGVISTEMVYGETLTQKPMFTGLKQSNCQWMF